MAFQVKTCNNVVTGTHNSCNSTHDKENNKLITCQVFSWTSLWRYTCISTSYMSDGLYDIRFDPWKTTVALRGANFSNSANMNSSQHSTLLVSPIRTIGPASAMPVIFAGDSSCSISSFSSSLLSVVVLVLTHDVSDPCANWLSGS